MRKGRRELKKFFYKNTSRLFATQGIVLVILQYILLRRLHIQLLAFHLFYLLLVGLIQIVGGVILGRAIRLLYIRANTDFLTGLYTRAVFYDHLNAKSSEKMCLLVLDVDDFKLVNDYYGHLAGDKVLVALAKLLHNEVRREDIVARTGGEEFAIILADTSLEEAILIGERIKNRVHETVFPYQGKYLSISVGISNMGTCNSAERMFQLADDALYRAKEKRNYVEIIECI